MALEAIALKFSLAKDDEGSLIVCSWLLSLKVWMNSSLCNLRAKAAS